MKTFSKLITEAFKFVPSETEEKRFEAGNLEAAKGVDEYIKGGSKGDLNLSYIKCSTLPDTLKVVNGNLDLVKTRIKTLPDNLVVKGDLDLQYSRFTEMPKNLTVRGNLNIANTPASFRYSEEDIRFNHYIYGDIHF